MYDFCMIAWGSLVWHFVRVGFGVYSDGHLDLACTVSGMDYDIELVLCDSITCAHVQASIGTCKSFE